MGLNWSGHSGEATRPYIPDIKTTLYLLTLVCHKNQWDTAALLRSSAPPSALPGRNRVVVNR